MARITLALSAVAALILAGSALWIGLEHLAPGIRWTGGVAPYPDILALHGLAGALLMPLIGAFAGFASPGRAARLAGWNGLAVAVALAGFLVLTDPLHGLPARDLLDERLLPGFDPSGDATIRAAITDAAGLWALFAGIGALLGAAPGFKWGGRAVQLIAGIFCATYLMSRTGGNEGLATAQLILPALAVFGLATLQLTQRDTAPAPHLWTGAALMVWSGATVAGDLSMSSLDTDTMADVAQAHQVIWGLVPFALLAAWRGYRGHQDGGFWAWGHALVLAALMIAWTWPLYILGYDGMPRGYADFPDSFAPGIREAAILGAFTILWTALGFILPAASAHARSAAHTS